MFIHETHDGAVVIRLTVDSLDAANTQEFRARLGGLGLGEACGATVDCSALSFLDSSGVGALLNVNNRLPDAARPATLENVAPDVRTVLELLRIDRILAVQKQAA